MLMKHNDDAHTRRIGELKTQLETLNSEMSELKTELETEIETLGIHSGAVVMLRRKEVGNPVDFFQKTFPEYQAGFEANGEIL